MSTKEKMVLQNDRRVFLKLAVAAGCTVLTLVKSGDAIARWSVNDFRVSGAADALDDLLAGAGAEETDLLTLEVPSDIENEALVPVLVKQQIPELQSLTVLVDSVDPIAASFHFDAEPALSISTRIRLVETTRIWVVASTANKHYISNAPAVVVPFSCGV